MLALAQEESCGAARAAVSRMTSAVHQPVLVESVLSYLQPRPGAIILDGTVGGGGHSLAILPHLVPDGRLIAMDRDADALARARQRLSEFDAVSTYLHDNFRTLRHHLDRLGLAGADGLLLDLGMSSPQVDQAERGFSFSHEGPLDMRMDRAQALTAAALVNDRSAEELTRLFAELGEERFARRIAQRIADERRTQSITTTTQLARIVTRAIPPGLRHGRVHAATRVFQALRMAVNDETGALECLLADLPSILNPGGRAVIISFHSLEDRRVKHAFAQGARDGAWTLLTKKPVPPSDKEAAVNPRSRSAKLRAVERLA